MPETSKPVRRLVSGIRPSGALHLGHYVGALRQWLDFQDTHECFFLLADVQVLATRREDAAQLGESVRDVVLDWLAVGLRPDHCSFVLQSRIPELAELTLYLQSLVRMGELRANPTTREEARSWGKGNFGEGVDHVDFGFLGYPISQAADTLIFSSSPPGEDDTLVVPVGFDQVPHVEFAAELARRFNDIYGPVFVEPQVKTQELSRLPGIDGGSKMGKSLKNAILLKDAADVSSTKVEGMFTDPLRERPEDPGHPDDCPCFLFRQAFGYRDLAARSQECKLGHTDCDECKTELAREVRAFLDPLQARRAEYAARPHVVAEILEQGTQRARRIAEATMENVRGAVGLAYSGLLGEVK